MSTESTGYPGGKSLDGSRGLSALASSLPTTPVVVAVVLATACGVVEFPGSAPAVGAPVITTVSIALAAVAMTQTEASSSVRKQTDPSGPTATLPRSSKRALILLAAAIAAACTAPAFDHTASASGSVGELVTLVLAACAMTLAGLELLHRAAGIHPAPPTPPSELPEASRGAPGPGWYRLGPSLESLSTESLCREWKLSFLALRATSDSLAHARVIEDRRRYLDELARRDPVGFQRWLSSDVYPVAGHPEKFIAGSHSPPPVGPVEGAQ